MTPDLVVARLERWRGWLKMAYVWNGLDEECFDAAMLRLKEDASVAAI
jgi:hypothetical protein